MVGPIVVHQIRVDQEGRPVDADGEAVTRVEHPLEVLVLAVRQVLGSLHLQRNAR